MKPIIVYVDDEPRNLTVLEASLSDEFTIFTFDNPLEALEKLEDIKPWIILSDQRMPGISGVQFLVLTQKLFPDSLRMIVTGYSDEDLVVDSVRKAQIFDYIRKPWDMDDLEAAMKKAAQFYVLNKEKNEIFEKLVKSEKELKEKNILLEANNIHLKKVEHELLDYKKELECWVPPFVLQALEHKEISFPIKKDLVGITFDIIDSSKTHDIILSNGHSLRSTLINKFSELLMTYGGWRESHSGDSCYGHFGVFEEDLNPFDSAMAVAREFRVALRGLCQANDIQIECGIAIHYAKNCTVSVHKAQINTPRGVVTQKSFDTTSTEVDLLHRMESLAHKLPGSNIILSEDFIKNLKHRPNRLIELGSHKFRGQVNSIKVFLIPSDLVDEDKLNELNLLVA